MQVRDDAVEPRGAIRDRVRHELQCRRVAQPDLASDRRAQMLRRALERILARLLLDGLAEHRVIRLRIAQVGSHRDVGDRDEPEPGIAKPLHLRRKNLLDGRAHTLGARVRTRPAHASSGDMTFTDACSSSTPGWVSTRRSTSPSKRCAWKTVSAMTETPTAA